MARGYDCAKRMLWPSRLGQVCWLRAWRTVWGPLRRRTLRREHCSQWPCPFPPATSHAVTQKAGGDWLTVGPKRVGVHWAWMTGTGHPPHPLSLS